MSDTACVKCERRSCRPPEYEPLCAKHYIESVKQAQKDAAARFEAHVAQLWASREASVSTPTGVELSPGGSRQRR